jgi:Fe-S-cluster containining protein
MGLPPRDTELIQIVDAALAEAAQKAGAWLACRVGCTQCCIGPFAITPLDAARLRAGLADLESRDPVRAARVRQRAEESAARLSREFTLDQLISDDAAGENEPCAALDPETGACDLYAARPITCRTFGPAVRIGGGALAVCELCFEGATDDEIAACEVDADPGNLEGALLAEIEPGDTIVAFALAATPASSFPTNPATIPPHPPDPPEPR